MEDNENQEIFELNQFEQLEKLTLVNLAINPYGERFIYNRHFTRKEITRYMQHPEIWPNQVRLRFASRYFYNVSTHYKRLVDYYANLSTLDYVIEPYGIEDPEKIEIDKMRKSYFKTGNKVENMNIKHEFRKVLDTAYKEDVFYGYIHENKDSFFIQPLDANFCRISSIEDGVYNFAFDFTYFNDYPFRLPFFPEEFQERARHYNDGTSIRWQELSAENTICIKINESEDYPVPPFLGIFQNVLDIQDFKDLQRQKTEIGNYKIVTQKIPMKNDNSTDQFAISLKNAQKFHNDIESQVGEQIGVITSPMELDVLDFKMDESDINKSYEQTSNFWSDSGTSNLLFSSGDGAGGSIALGNSIKTDESMMFSALKQLERWLNRYLKNNTSGKYKFKVRILDNTIFNRKEKLQDYNLQAQSGFATRNLIMASMGHSPTASSLQSILENQVLDLNTNMIPLQTSYTQSSSDSKGRPTKDEGDLSDEGIKSKDNKKNDKSRPK